MKTKSLFSFILIFSTIICTAQVKKVSSKTSVKKTTASNASVRSNCPIYLDDRTGTVYAAGPANMYVTPATNEIDVTINKTDGKARTTVNIYANNAFKDRIIFENGRDTPSKSKTITGVANKQVRVEIVNGSVANTFKYRATIAGEHFSLMPDRERAEGKLSVGQTKRTITTTQGSCTGKTRVVVNRTSGNARGTIRIWEQRGNTWSQIKSVTMENSTADSKKIFDLNTGRKLKIEVKNISVGNQLGYTINAIARK